MSNFSRNTSSPSRPGWWLTEGCCLGVCCKKGSRWLENRNHQTSPSSPKKKGMEIQKWVPWGNISNTPLVCIFQPACGCLEKSREPTASRPAIFEFLTPLPGPCIKWLDWTLVKRIRGTSCSDIFPELHIWSKFPVYTCKTLGHFAIWIHFAVSRTMIHRHRTRPTRTSFPRFPRFPYSLAEVRWCLSMGHLQSLIPAAWTNGTNETPGAQCCTWLAFLWNFKSAVSCCRNKGKQWIHSMAGQWLIIPKEFQYSPLAYLPAG